MKPNYHIPPEAADASPPYVCKVFNTTDQVTGQDDLVTIDNKRGGRITIGPSEKRQVFAHLLQEFGQPCEAGEDNSVCSDDSPFPEFDGLFRKETAELIDNAVGYAYGMRPSENPKDLVNTLARLAVHLGQENATMEQTMKENAEELQSVAKDFVDTKTVADQYETQIEKAAHFRQEVLEHRILFMVRGGATKTEVKKALGGADEWTYDEVSQTFDDLLERDFIRPGDSRGKYTTSANPPWPTAAAESP